MIYYTKSIFSCQEIKAIIQDLPVLFSHFAKKKKKMLNFHYYCTMHFTLKKEFFRHKKGSFILLKKPSDCR